jgi:hypothetical protein
VSVARVAEEGDRWPLESDIRRYCERQTGKSECFS